MPKIDFGAIAGRIQQVTGIIGIVVPAVQQITSVVLQIAAQAQARGWDVDTSSLIETKQKFDAIAAEAAAEKAKYQGKR